LESPNESAPLEIRMDGIFDVAAAQQVVRALESAPQGRWVRIDLTRVHELHDFALAFLAQALARHRENVSILGLGQHQLRMLSYLGLGQVADSPDATVA
jgi:hypothetical protein